MEYNFDLVAGCIFEYGLQNCEAAANDVWERASASSKLMIVW